MALVKYGGGIIQLSGSIAGNTFARNRSGSYVRAKTKPINPNTARQQVVKSSLAMLTDRWSQVVTAVQRTAWNLYATNVSMKNRLSDTIILTGFNHYIRSNMLLLQSGITLIDAGPTVFELPEKDPTFAISSSAGTQLISITFDNTLDWANEDEAYMVVFQGNPQNPQRNFFAGPWRLIGQIDGDGTTAPTSPVDLATDFFVSAGQAQWCYARILRADGRLSEQFSVGPTLVGA